MNRMLLGDVGTGKTLVAAHALACAADAGAQAAMMAPTEVLANQYAGAVGPLLDAAGIRWALLDRLDARSRSAVSSSGCWPTERLQVLFGTHALLEESVGFKRLTLAIVDEQHRFGVNQRLGLRGKGAAPDLLVMTATPIPRSLALTLYGDLETSYLRDASQLTAGGEDDTCQARPARPRLRARASGRERRPAGLRRVRARRRVRGRRGARRHARVRASAHEGLLGPARRAAHRSDAGCREGSA